MARTGLRWGRVAGAALAATCVVGTISCSEDQPDTGPDAAADARSEPRSDTTVGTDVGIDRSVVDQREAGTPDVSADGGAPDGPRPEGGMPEGGAPDAAPEGGNCVGGGDAARDGASGMIAVQSLGCANCHQDQPVDAGLILSGRLTSIVNDAGVFPKNLTPDPTTGLGCWTDDQIINAIMNGIGGQGQTLCSRMPMFRTRIDGGTPQQIVDFLRTLPAVNKAIPDTLVCPPRPPPPEGGTDADGGAPSDGTAPDGAAPDAGEGGSPPDAGPDDAAPDAGADGVTPDVNIDAGTNDVDIDGGG